MGNSEIVEELFDYVVTVPDGTAIDIDPHIESGVSDEFYYKLNIYFDECCALDVREDRISAAHASSELRDILLDVTSSDNRVEEFERRVKDWVSEIKQSGWYSYEVAFPLNMVDSPKMPENFSVTGTQINNITRDQWVENYLNPARQENDSLSNYFSRIPNDPSDRDYTYWVLKCEATDGGFATHTAFDYLRTLLARITFADCLWRHRPSSSKIPRVRWSRLREPFMILVFEDSSFHTLQIRDYDNRRPESIRWHDEEMREVFDSIPDFSEPLSELESDVNDALRAYLAGITELDVNESFFAFWRGIEILSQKGRGDNAEVAKKRADFAREFVAPEMIREDVYNDVISDFEDIRNEIAHEGYSRTTEYHQIYAKILLDSLLRLYFEYMDDLDKQELEFLLDYGAASDDGKGELRTRNEKLRRVIDFISEETA
ncbi:hypothetical protein [Halorussus marinus]|uniref:hypothetical protein n=1 Tax=Halorussus marinus TaxID=2505976 RepID=UPI0010928E9B|nr:hypothetical protein [Halorussus marinus]